MEYKYFIHTISNFSVIWNNIALNIKYIPVDNRDLFRIKHPRLRVFSNYYNINYLWPVSEETNITKIKPFIAFELSATASIIVYSKFFSINSDNLIDKTKNLLVLGHRTTNYIEGLLLYKLTKFSQTKTITSIIPEINKDQYLKILDGIKKHYTKTSFYDATINIPNDTNFQNDYSTLLKIYNNPKISYDSTMIVCVSTTSSRSANIKYLSDFIENLIVSFLHLSEGGTLLLFLKIDPTTSSFIREFIYFILKFFSNVNYTIDSLDYLSILLVFENYKPVSTNILKMLLNIHREVKSTLEKRYLVEKKSYNEEYIQIFDFNYTEDYLNNIKIIEDHINTIVSKINKDFGELKTVLIQNNLDNIESYTGGNANFIRFAENEFHKHDVVVLNKCIQIANEINLPVSSSYLDINNKIKEKMIKYLETIPKPHIYTFRPSRLQITDFDPNSNPEFFTYQKKRLNLNKTYIDLVDHQKWTRIRLKTNIPLYIKKYVDSKFNIKKASRAFIKIFELYSLFDGVISRAIKDGVLKSLHICEAPGEFIAATNYYARSKYNIKNFDWCANSLNHKSMIAIAAYGKDIFADDFGFMKKYPSNWLYGADESGDITNILNINHIIAESKKKLGPILLFTSDAGQDVSDDFNEQENKLALVHYAQAYTALKALDKGGSCILKMYIPFSVRSNRDIIYLLYRSFEKIHIVKQIAGSPGSSEIYLVGENYLNVLSPELDPQMQDQIKNFNSTKALFDSYDEDFMDMLTKASYKLVDKQIAIIQRNFYYYNNDKVFEEHTSPFEVSKRKLAEYWCKKTGIKQLDQKLQL